MTRSYLFVPADSERKLLKAQDSTADALILDLEDAVDASALPRARAMAADYLAGKDNVWVRINPMQTADAAADLAAVVPAKPTGIVLPKPPSAAAAIQLAKQLDQLEQQHGIDVGDIRILPLCTEHPAALFSLQEYRNATPRLQAMSWGAEDLSAAIGVSASRDASGAWLPTFELARSLCLLAACNAAVAAVDTVFTDFKDDAGLRRYAEAARRDGFSGMLAIHPNQIDIINAAFEVSAAEREWANKVVALFADNPGSGAISLDGKMIDKPHLLQAQRLLGLDTET